MAEVTYVTEVECDIVVQNGILDSQVVCVLDDRGRKHTLRVGKGGVVEKDGKTYLPVGLVHIDRERKLACSGTASRGRFGY